MKKLYINTQNRKEKLQFQKQYKSKKCKCWDNVIFADESKFNIVSIVGIKIWQKRKETHKLKHLQVKIKHNDNSMMV